MHSHFFHPPMWDSLPKEHSVTVNDKLWWRHYYFFFFWCLFLKVTLKKIFFYVYFWETETEHKQGRGRERERYRIRSRLQAVSCQHRAQRGAWTHVPWDCDLNWNQTLNRLSHQAPLKVTCFRVAWVAQSVKRPTLLFIFFNILFF